MSCSASRFVRPSTDVESAALSVEMLTNVSTPNSWPTLSRFCVPSDVGLEALLGVHLEQRQVLERGGVEDDLGAVLLEHLDEAVTVADAGDDEVAGSRAGRGPRSTAAPPAAPTRPGRA